MNEDYSDTSGYSRLFLAVHNGEINLLPSLLKKYSSTRNIRGKALINVAAARGHAEIVRMLINKDTDVNTLLNIAIVENQPSVFNLVIKECNFNEKDCNKEAIFYAIENNCVEFVKILLENGASVDVRDGAGNTPLFYALETENVELADELFKNGAIFTEDDYESWDLISPAGYCNGNLEMIKLLMNNGWNKIDTPNDEDKTPLHSAVSAGDLKMVEYLMKNGSKSDETFTEDSLELFDACFKSGRIDILKFLIDNGLKTRRCILHNFWMWERQNKIWKYILTCRSKIDPCAYFNQTQLHWAVRAGELEIVKILTKQEANTVDKDSLPSRLAVYIAVENGNEDILQVLLDAGYSTDRCFDDAGPLHLAATYEHTRLVQMLLKAEVDSKGYKDVDSFTTRGHTPLHFAAVAGLSNMVEFLLENGADAQQGEERTPLSLALKVFSSLREPITPVMFANLVEITKMLIPYEAESDYYELLNYASEIGVHSDENEKSILISNSKEEISNVNKNENIFRKNVDCQKFRLELIKCIFNHLADDTMVQLHSRQMLEDCYSSRSPELLHLLMEYNDSESCSRITVNDRKADYNCQLLLIDYSSNVSSLLNVRIKTPSTSNNEDEKTKNTLILKLIIARLLLLLNCVRDSRLLEFCTKHELFDWHDECMMQKLKMKETQIDDNFKVTFLDILTEPVETVANYVRNESFHNAIESSLEKFPAFSEFLKIRIEKGVRRNKLREECRNLMYNLIKENHKIVFSSDELDQIFNHLSLIDLRRFSEAFL